MEDPCFEPVSPQTDLVGHLDLHGLVHPVAIVEEDALVVPGQLDVVPVGYVSSQLHATAAQEQAVSSDDGRVLSRNRGAQLGGRAEVHEEIGDGPSIAA